jgi:hypothetical protein
MKCKKDKLDKSPTQTALREKLQLICCVRTLRWQTKASHNMQFPPVPFWEVLSFTPTHTNT